MAAAYSVALFAGCGRHRVHPEPQTRARRPARAAALARPDGSHGRLLLACLPAGALGYAAARFADAAGDFAAAGAGTLTLAAVVALLARPLGLTGITALLTGARRRLRR